MKYTSTVSMMLVLALSGCSGGGGSSKHQLNEPVAHYDAATTREELVASVCDGEITRLPDDVTVGADYDVITSVLADGSRNQSYWYHPVTPNGEVFIYYQGHRGDPRKHGGSTIKGLVQAGYEVVAFQMPDVDAGHNKYNDVDHGLCIFVEPVIRVLNYFTDRGYDKVHMTGISSGGWTTSVVAAMDNRITSSYPVAGGIPGKNGGDFEQRAMFTVMDMGDMWRISNHTVAIQNFNDPCCSSGSMYETYDAGPNFVGLVDYANNSHSISQWSLDIIIAEAATVTE